MALEAKLTLAVKLADNSDAVMEISPNLGVTNGYMKMELKAGNTIVATGAVGQVEGSTFADQLQKLNQMVTAEVIKAKKIAAGQN